MGLNAEIVFSVGEFVECLNHSFTHFKGVRIRGEVQKVTQRSHAYFTLADPQGQAVLECVMWQSRYRSSGVVLEPGMEIEVAGTPNIYAPSGRFSVVVDRLTPIGEGALQKAFEQLKLKLEREGFFAPERKRQLPEYVESVAVVTSREGEALQDFLKHLSPCGMQIQLYDARVEGVQSADSLCSALERISSAGRKVDAVVVTRGGGSLQSLQAFNTESVARAIAACPIPVISAVGHERDVTIADLVADVRASTPTDAARILSEDWRAAPRLLATSQQNWHHTWQLAASNQAERLSSISTRLSSVWQLWLDAWSTRKRQLSVSAARLEGEIQRVAETLEYTQVQLFQSYSRGLERGRQRILHHEQLLIAHDPHRKLAQGYSIARMSGKVVKSVAGIAAGQSLVLQLSDGELTTLTQGPDEN
jgi:exodeoxyribonuclease VII large subunit